MRSFLTMQQVYVKEHSRKKRPTSPFCVYYYAAGKKVTHWLPNKTKALEKKKELVDAFGDVAIPPDAAAAVKHLWGTGISLLDAAKFAAEHMQRQLERSKITVNEAIPLFEKDGLKNGNRETTVASYERTFPPYKQRFGDRQMASVTKEEMEKFFDRPKTPGKRGGWNRESKKTYLRVGRALWRWAGIPWPAPKYKVPKEDEENGVDYWTIREITAALLVCPPEWRGNLAVALFVGIRPETTLQLRPKWFDEAKNEIHIPAWAIKTRVPYDLADVPPVLWEWLRSYPVREMSCTALIQRFRRQGVRYSQDIARHTCGTYTFRKHGLDGVVRVLGHASVKLIRSNYANNGASLAEADEFFALTPTKIYPGGDLKWRLAKGEDHKGYLPALPTPALVKKIA